MTLDPAIMTLLSGIVEMETKSRSGRRQLGGATPAERLRAVLDLVGDTVLPRSYGIFSGTEPVAAMTVASGRIVKLTQAGGGADEIGAQTESRDTRLAGVAMALARLSKSDGPLTIETNYVADELAAEDVGQSAKELRDICAGQRWFADGPDRVGDANGLTLSQVMLGAGGSLGEAVGDPTLTLTAAAAVSLATEVTQWRDEIVDLAGKQWMIALRAGPGQNALTLAPAGDEIAVSICEDHNVAALSRFWTDGKSSGEGGE